MLLFFFCLPFREREFRSARVCSSVWVWYARRKIIYTYLNCHDCHGLGTANSSSTYYLTTDCLTWLMIVSTHSRRIRLCNSSFLRVEICNFSKINVERWKIAVPKSQWLNRCRPICRTFLSFKNTWKQLTAALLFFCRVCVCRFFFRLKILFDKMLLLSNDLAVSYHRSQRPAHNNPLSIMDFGFFYFNARVRRSSKHTNVRFTKSITAMIIFIKSIVRKLKCFYHLIARTFARAHIKREIDGFYCEKKKKLFHSRENNGKIHKKVQGACLRS